MGGTFKTGITFQDVIDQDLKGYEGLLPAEKTHLADIFFTKHVATQPGYSTLNPDQQNEVRAGFNEKYNVGQVVGRDGLLDTLNKGLTTFNLATGSVVDPAVSAMTFGLANPRQQQEIAQRTFPGIATDPGIMGKAYRFYSNPIPNTLGSVLGAFGGTSAIVKGLPQGLSRIGKNMIGAGAFSGGTNAVSAFKGQQTPLEALFNTAADTAIAPLAGKTRIGNALIQGAGGGAAGGAASVISDLARQRQIDTERAKHAILQAVALNAGIGAAFHVPEPTKVREIKLQGEKFKLSAQKLKGRFSPEDSPQVKSFKRQIELKINNISNSQSLSEQKTYQSKLNDYNTLFKILNQVASQDQDMNLRRVAEENKLWLQKEYDNLRREYGAKFPTARQAAANKKVVSGKVNAPVLYEKLVTMGVQARKTNEGKAKFENFLSKTYTPDEKRTIYGKIKDAEARAKTKERTETILKENRSGEERAIYAERLRQAKAETVELRKKQKEFQKQEITQQKELGLHALILDNAEILEKAEQLLRHHQSGEKGTLEALVKTYKRYASTDFTKQGATEERNQAINESYRSVLDQFNHLKNKSNEKPSVVQMKAGQEQNRLELEKLESQGGRYTPGEDKALQRPVKGLTLEQIKKSAEWDALDAGTKDKAAVAMKAAKENGKVIIEYDAERSGDTGQFKLKTVSPLSLDFVDDKLVMYAVNKNGHTGMYYLSASKANNKTGFSSFTYDITPLKETAGQGFKSLDSNIYLGQQSVPVQEILSRPQRETAGYTSDLEANVIKAMKGLDVKEVKAATKAIKRAVMKAKKEGASAEGTGQAIINPARFVIDEGMTQIYNEAGPSRESIHKDLTGEDC